MRKGTLKMEIIKDLMGSLNELKAHSNFEEVNIVLSMDGLEVLVDQIFEYTKKLQQIM